MSGTADTITTYRQLGKIKRRLIRQGMSPYEATHAAMREMWPTKVVEESEEPKMNTLPVVPSPTTAIAHPAQILWSDEQRDLIKRTIAKGATDDELSMFLHVAQRTGLDPFTRQLHAIKRWDRQAGREVMAIQTGIDGYRLVAERTGKYAPGAEPVHTYDANGKLVKSTAFVKKLTADGTWHEISASAHYAEYVQTTKDGKATRFWERMPHVMLDKVAEALALRRAFPQELSGLYISEELQHADMAAPPPPEPERPPRTGAITKGEAGKLLDAAKAAGHSKDDLAAWLLRMHSAKRLGEIMRGDFDAILARLRDAKPLAEDQPAAVEVVDESETITLEPADSAAIEL